MKEETVIKVAEIFASSLENSSIETVATILIPALVTILGLFFNNASLKRTFKNELQKQKNQISLEKLGDIPSEAISLLDKIFGKEDVFEEIKNLHKIVFAYGSVEAINIIADMQKYAYANDSMNEKEKKDDIKESNLKMMCYLIILVVQIKFDVTDIIVNPEKWYIIKIKDYEEKRNLLIKFNNDIVIKLNLKKEYLINV